MLIPRFAFHPPGAAATTRPDTRQTRQLSGRHRSRRQLTADDRRRPAVSRRTAHVHDGQKTRPNHERHPHHVQPAAADGGRPGERRHRSGCRFIVNGVVIIHAAAAVAGRTIAGAVADSDALSRRRRIVAGTAAQSAVTFRQVVVDGE